jgi:outer membrane protein assembly factor BamB
MGYRIAAITVSVALGLLSAALMATAADWQMQGGNRGHTGSSEDQITLPISLQWMYRTDDMGRNRASAVTDGGKIFFCTEKVVFCLHEDSGDLLWQYPSKGKLASSIWNTPLAVDGILYVPLLSGSLIALDEEAGTPVWTYNAKKSIGNSPTFYNGAVYFGSADKKLYAIEAKAGTPVWQDGSFSAPESVISAPTIADDLVFFTCNDLHVYAVDAASGEARWSQPLPFPAPGMSPVASKGLVFVPTTHGILALNTRGGAARWLFKTEGVMRASPAVSEAGVFFGTDSGDVLCVDLFGKKQWEVRLDGGVRSEPAVSGDTVFVGTTTGVFYGLDARSGKELWSYRPEKGITEERKAVYFGFYAQPTVANGSLYLVTERGDLLAFSSAVKDTAPPTISYMQRKADKPISGEPPVKISAVVEDLGSGLDPDSIRLALDDKPVTHEFDSKSGRITYETKKTQPVIPMADGTHKVTLTVSDASGNSVTKTWTFTVDNSLRG